jgi:O-6-methylguanine DNA methyltransferase
MLNLPPPDRPDRDKARRTLQPRSKADARHLLTLVPCAPKLRHERLTRPELTVSRLPSPIGEILIATDHTETLRAIDFGDFEQRMVRLLRRHYGYVDLREAEPAPQHRHAIDSYFAGDHGALEPLSMATAGSPFQHRVWTALLDIPSGTTASYAWIADRIGARTAVRAVGLANGANPIAIAVPCHRVVGAHGHLTGYGGGLSRKDWLLRHEGAEPGRRPFLSAARIQA